MCTYFMFVVIVMFVYFMSCNFYGLRIHIWNGNSINLSSLYSDREPDFFLPHNAKRPVVTVNRNKPTIINGVKKFYQWLLAYIRSV